jgi:hypothetical protein
MGGTVVEGPWIGVPVAKSLGRAISGRRIWDVADGFASLSVRARASMGIGPHFLVVPISAIRPGGGQMS